MAKYSAVTIWQKYYINTHVLKFFFAQLVCMPSRCSSLHWVSFVMYQGINNEWRDVKKSGWGLWEDGTGVSWEMLSKIKLIFLPSCKYCEDHRSTSEHCSATVATLAGKTKGMLVQRGHVEQVWLLSNCHTRIQNWNMLHCKTRRRTDSDCYYVAQSQLITVLRTNYMQHTQLGNRFT